MGRVQLVFFMASVDRVGHWPGRLDIYSRLKVFKDVDDEHSQI